MEPQASEANQLFILALHVTAVLGLLFFLRRINIRNKRNSYRRVHRLISNYDQAQRNIRRIEDEQWHERLSSKLRISRYQLALSPAQLEGLARIDRYQQNRRGH